jgi:hypothetical protein
MWVAAVTFVVVFLLAEPALAWGPITHLVHGSQMLGKLSILGVSLQHLLRRHHLEYLYGCVGADITQAKKYTRAQQAHCHSWEVGWTILERARTDRQRAFAWGYLTHLTGDVYSHNHFVPTQLLVSFRARTLRHVYWEARFDNQQHVEHREVIAELRQHRFKECDDLVENVVSRTLFSFRTDKRIFNSFIAVHDLQQWHRIMHGLSRRSRYLLPPEVVSRYNEVCHANIADVFRRGKHADCQLADPTGMEAMRLAKKVRRTLRALERQGRLTSKLQKQIDQLDEHRELDPGSICGGLALSTAS